MVAEVRFARKEHGNHRVVREGKQVRVHWPQGVRMYPNARRAIVALYNRDPDADPERAPDPHLTWDRYFRRGRYRSRPEPRVDIFDFFKPDAPNTVAVTKAPPLVVDTSLAVHIPEPEVRLGIDLEGRYIEVRKIFFAGFAARIHRMGYDPEEVFQELCKGLLVRNKGKCPWDARKSSFGHYIHMVAGCILSNYRRRWSRVERAEVYGAVGADGEEKDFALSNHLSCGGRQEDAAEWDSVERGLIPTLVRGAPGQGLDPKTVRAVVPLLSEGFNYKEIAAQISVSASMVSRIARFIRRVASDWR